MVATSTVGAIVLVVVASGCGSSSSPSQPARPSPPRDCPSERPTGSASDYTAPTDLADITIAEPQLCDRGEAYIRVERTTGARRLGTRRDPQTGGFREGCTTLPSDPGDPAQCPVIDAGTILNEAVAELRKRAIEINGVGAGPCGTISGDYTAWNMAVGVVSWRDAEPAVRIVADLLARYDLAGFTGVAVRGIPCAVLL